MKIKIVLIVLFAYFAELNAQSAPGTDIFLADLSISDGKISIGQLKNITNRLGYDNQPFFLPASTKVLYTAEFETSELEKQTDIMLLDYKSGKLKNLTNSPENEFSPALMPNGIEYSVIHQVDGKQQLWAYQLDGKGRRPLLQNDFKIGYHAWIDEEHVLITVLQDKGMNLQVANLISNSTKTLAPLAGPSLFKIPEKTSMSFSTFIEEQHRLMQLDSMSGEKRQLVEMPNGAFYYAWTADGKVITADKSQLWFWDSMGKESALKSFASFEKTCPSGVTRIAINSAQTKLALVCHGESL